MLIDGAMMNDNKIEGVFSLYKLHSFLSLSRKYLARAQEMTGFYNCMSEFERMYLPAGYAERDQYGRVVWYVPEDEEFPRKMSYKEGLEFSTMTPATLYRHCLSKGHVLKLYPEVNLAEFLLYFSHARKLFPNPFCEEIEEWIEKIAKENTEYQHDEYLEID